MSFPIKTCVVCGEEFELKPEKPGFANRCPDCTESDAAEAKTRRPMDADERKSKSEVQKQFVNINQLCEDCLTLAFNSARSKHPGMGCEVKTDFAKNLSLVKAVQS